MEIQKIESFPESGGNDFKPQKAILVIIGFLFVVWFLWFLFFRVGFLNISSFLNSGQNNATSTQNSGKINLPTEKSLYSGWIKISDITYAQENYPTKEYILISVVQPNLSAVDASKWKLVNSLGETTPLGQVAELPSFGKVNTLSALKLKGGDELIISTGRSPIGSSFRMNSCAPYFEQFQDFIPPIETYNCPNARSTSGYSSLSYECQDFVANLRECETPTQTIPTEYGSSCKTFVDAHVGYAGCVSDRKREPGFYSNILRIFLNKDRELWSQKDTITLLDQDGKIIDQVKY